MNENKIILNIEVQEINGVRSPLKKGDHPHDFLMFYLNKRLYFV